MALTQQDSGTEHTPEATVSDDPPCSHQDDQVEDVPEGAVGVAYPNASTDLSTKDQEETDTKKNGTVKAKEQDTEGDGGEYDGEEGKGVKRKREDMQREEEVGQSTEKKKV